MKGTIQDHHEYPVTGKDSLGEIECMRRFQHFVDFRMGLTARYPGLYIPPIPPKKMQGKKESSLVSERQYFLDLFLKECCNLRYLAASKEMQVFLRPTGDVTAALKKISAPKTQDQIAIYRATVPINENFEEREVRQFQDEINDFIRDQKELMTHLMSFKKTLKMIVPLKEQENQYYN